MSKAQKNPHNCPERSIRFRKIERQFWVFRSVKGGRGKVRNIGHVGECRGGGETKKNPTDNDKTHRWKRGKAEMLE